MGERLTTDMSEEGLRPYFLWDEDLTIREVRQHLAGDDDAERVRLLAKILREARDDEVWQFSTVRQILDLWPRLAPRLGRRRAFWEFLFDAWKRQGLAA